MSDARTQVEATKPGLNFMNLKNNKQSWSKERKEREAGYKRKWANKNKEYQRQYYLKNREKIVARTTAWEKLNKSRIRQRVQKQTRNRKLRTIAAYGGFCACCKITEIEFLTIDHINGNGKSHRQEVGSGTAMYRWLEKRDYPKDNFRILCMNCNWASRGGSDCPHSLARTR